MGREFSISTAKESQEALEIVREQGPFDVVVSDMRMPGMDGATLLRTIKEENPQIMTILLTGHAEFEFGGSQALQTGILFKILNKPCPPHKLSAAIRAAIEEKEGKDQGEEKPPETIL